MGAKKTETTSGGTVSYENGTYSPVPSGTDKKKWYEVAGGLLESISNVINGIGNVGTGKNGEVPQQPMPESSAKTNPLLIIVGVIILIALLYVLFKMSKK